MEYLTLEDSSYSDGKKGQSNKDKVNIVLSVVKQGLEVKSQTKLNEFVGGLTDSHKKYFTKVSKSKSTDQEKAIISALLNKYPKLKVNEAQQREFREHLSNMLSADKLDEGALKYLVERLLEIDKQKKKEEKKEKEQEDAVQPEAEAPEGEEVAGEGEQEMAPQAADTENSDLDFYSEWEKEFNNNDCELTEDDFNDIIDYNEVDGYLQYPSRERMSSEWLKNNPINKAEKFLNSKRKQLSKETKYSSLMVAEDFIVSKQLSKDSEYSTADYYTESPDSITSTVKNKLAPKSLKTLDLTNFKKAKSEAKSDNRRDAIVSTAVGAVAGSKLSKAITFKLRKEWETLKEKKDKTPEEISKMNSLKKKLARSKMIGMVSGGAAGFALNKKYGKKTQTQDYKYKYLDKFD